MGRLLIPYHKAGKSLPRENTLFHRKLLKFTAVKSVITLSSGVNVIRLFYSSLTKTPSKLKHLLLASLV